MSDDNNELYAYNFYDNHKEHLTAYPIVEVPTSEVKAFGHTIPMRPKSHAYYMQAPHEDWPIVTFVLFTDRKGRKYPFPIDGMHRIQVAVNRNLSFIQGIIIPVDELRENEPVRKAAWQCSYVRLQRKLKPKAA